MQKNGLFLSNRVRTYLPTAVEVLWILCMTTDNMYEYVLLLLLRLLLLLLLLLLLRLLLLLLLLLLPLLLLGRKAGGKTEVGFALGRTYLKGAHDVGVASLSGVCPLEAYLVQHADAIRVVPYVAVLRPYVEHSTRAGGRRAGVCEGGEKQQSYEKLEANSRRIEVRMKQLSMRQSGMFYENRHKM